MRRLVIPHRYLLLDHQSSVHCTASFIDKCAVPSSLCLSRSDRLAHEPSRSAFPLRSLDEPLLVSTPTPPHRPGRSSSRAPAVISPASVESASRSPRSTFLSSAPYDRTPESICAGNLSTFYYRSPHFLHLLSPVIRYFANTRFSTALEIRHRSRYFTTLVLQLLEGSIPIVLRAFQALLQEFASKSIYVRCEKLCDDPFKAFCCL